jgi:hypothetical protein
MRLFLLVCLLSAASAATLAACGDGPADAATTDADAVSTDAGDASAPTDAPADAGDAAQSDAGENPSDVAELGDSLNDVSTDPADVFVDGSGVDASELDGDTADVPDGPEAFPWRSIYYETDWTPPEPGDGTTRLPDFSFAGYRYGVEPPIVDLPVFDVVAEGADPTGMADSTAAFASAIAAAEPAGGIVAVPEGLFRIDGTLRVTRSDVVVRGVGAEASRLWFTRSEGMDYGAHLSFAGGMALGAEVALVEDAPEYSTIVAVTDVSSFVVGDRVAIGWTITPEFVAAHNMTGVWRAFNDTWQPFFWREIVEVDADRNVLEVDVPLRYNSLVRDGASVRHTTGWIENVGVEGIGVSNAVAWDEAWAHNQVHAISFDGVVDGWIRDVRSFVSPSVAADSPIPDAHLQSSGLEVRRSARVTIADVSLANAQNRGGGGNGYLFEVRQSSEILTRDSVGTAGRHNFIQNWGFGLTGCVWLRVQSSGGVAAISADLPIGPTGYSETHHSLAMSNLVDQSIFDDGWSMVNRQDYSTGAGITATGNVVWNARGTGLIESRQFALGYIIGTSPTNRIEVGTLGDKGEGTAPEDVVEGRGLGGWLVPASLYEDQRLRRIERETAL